MQSNITRQRKLNKHHGANNKKAIGKRVIKDLKSDSDSGSRKAEKS
jgi:hypothetical protein